MPTSARTFHRETPASARQPEPDSNRGSAPCRKFPGSRSRRWNMCCRDGKAYGNARGLNNRRSCSLITLETDDGVTGYRRRRRPARRGPRIHQAADAVLRRPQPLRLRHRGEPRFATSSITSARRAISSRPRRHQHRGVTMRSARRWACRCTTCSAAAAPSSSPATPPPAISPTIRRSTSRRSLRRSTTTCSSATRSRSAPASPPTSSACAPRARRSATSRCLMVDYQRQLHRRCRARIAAPAGAVQHPLGRGAAAAGRRQGLRRVARARAGAHLGRRGALRRARLQAADRGARRSTSCSRR